VIGSGAPGSESFREALSKAEEVLSREAQSPKLDAKTQKTLEDLAQLVGSVRQIETHKDIGHRVQKIAEETKMAIDEAGTPGVPSEANEATQQAIQFAQKMRPLFQLLVISREFRVLIVDSLEIVRRIFVRHEKEPAEKAKAEFLEGGHPAPIAQEAAQKSKDSFQNNKGELQVAISDEEWEGLQDDFTRVLSTIARQPSYQQGVEILLELLDTVRVGARQAANQAAQATETAQPHARRARMETEELIATFSGREALDNFIESIKQLVRKVEQDERSKKYLSELRKFIESTKSPEFVQQQEFKERTKRLANEARDISREYQYADEVEEFLDSADTLVRNIRNDEFVEVLRHHAGLVADDLSFVDSSGQVQLDQEMLNKLRTVVLPILAESLKYIPIPRIESCDKNREYWVDNIVLCGYDVLPDHFRVQLESDSDISIRDIETKHSYTKLIITLGQIRTELKDLEFYYKKKTFPEISDSGRVTLRVGGTHGATLKLTFRVEQTKSDKLPKFKEGSASFDIEKFDMTFNKSTISHDVLLPIFSQLFKAQIQHQIETEVENSFEKLFEKLGDQLTEALSSVNRPLVSGLEQIRKIGKNNPFGQTYEQRQQKLE